MKVMEQDARKMLIAMGLKDAKDWPLKKIHKRLLEVEALADTAEEFNGEERTLFLNICDALKDGDKLELEGMENHETNGHGEPVVKASKKKAEKKPAAKKAKAEKDETKRDAYGSVLGSDQAKFNDCLSNKPQTMRELLDAAGLKETMYNHINNLIKKKQVLKSKNAKTGKIVYIKAPKKG